METIIKKKTFVGTWLNEFCAPLVVAPWPGPTTLGM